jgi:DNA-directed RNA polymerase subunit beta'
MENASGEDKIFNSPNDAINAWDFNVVDFRAKIKVLGTENLKYAEYSNQIFETTVGRLLFNSVLPSDYPFLNKMMDQKAISELETDLIAVYGLNGMAKILDSIKDFGFEHATKSGITWSNDDLTIPSGKKAVVEKTNKEVLGN